MAQRIRLVTFDILHTIVTPRLPVHVQYSQTFSPYLGELDPESLKRSFKVALKAVQEERPVYDKGTQAWWGDVIRRAAIGAGADVRALDASLSDIVLRLMARFSTKEGYKEFDDVLPTLHQLHHKLAIHTAVISNADSRIRSVIQDLGFPASLNPLVLSEEEGIEKPSSGIFLRTLQRVNTQQLDRGQAVIRPEQCLHVGDELECDYNGAVNAGMNALLLRRAGSAGEQAHKEPDECLNGVEVTADMHGVLRWVEAYNRGR